MRADLWIIGSLLLLQGILFHALPKLSRRDIFFGVTVPLDALSAPELKSILLVYRMQVWLWTLAGLALLWMASWQRSAPLLVSAMILQLAGVIVAWALAHRKAKPAAMRAPPAGHAAVAGAGEPFPGGLLFLVGPFLILVAASLFLSANWELIPDRFPVHWRADGTPDRWAARSFRSVYGALLIGASICGLMLFASYATLRLTRQVRPAGPESGYEHGFKRATVLLLTALSYMMALMFSGIAVRPVWATTDRMGAGHWILVLAPLALAVLMIIVLVRMGQGGSRLAAAQSATDDSAFGDGTPDSCWKWGMIYYNPEDPVLFVEKRMGLGWTLNFGNRFSWVFLGAAVGVPLLVAMLVG